MTASPHAKQRRDERAPWLSLKVAAREIARGHALMVARLSLTRAVFAIESIDGRVAFPVVRKKTGAIVTVFDATIKKRLMDDGRIVDMGELLAMAKARRAGDPVPRTEAIGAGVVPSLGRVDTDPDDSQDEEA